MKTRVLYILERYPQISETYVKSEIEAVGADYDLRILTLHPADIASAVHLPFAQLTTESQLVQVVQEFKPHVLHTHYLHTAEFVDRVARAIRLPYTVRAHSYDAIFRQQNLALSELCLGVLTFPFTRGRLAALGVPMHKIVDCYPVMHYARFHDSSPVGQAVLNLGACRPKKKFEDFIDLATLVPDKEFNLISIGYLTKQVRDYNIAKGGRVSMHSVVQPEEMPAVYKKHGWLVYTACPQRRDVGWPIAVAEAQASGLGVCMARVRPDLEEYIGGAGFLYDSINELPAILSKPYPEEMRQRGFEQAKKSDIAGHRKLLTDLWDACHRA